MVYIIYIHNKEKAKKNGEKQEKEYFFRKNLFSPLETAEKRSILFPRTPNHEPNKKGQEMKITVEISDEMTEKIDLEAKKDGHTNRNAVIRKALNSFFADELRFSSVETQENKNRNEAVGA